MSAQPAVFPSVIDNSMREYWVACRHKWFRRHCQGLAPRSTSNVHLHFGKCFAAGLHTTRVCYYGGSTAQDSLLHGSRRILSEWGDYEMPDLPPPASNKTLSACLDALLSYFIEYPLESDRVRALDIGHGTMAETSFAVPIPGCYHPVTGEPLIYAGRFDMVGTIGSAVWVVDEKTTTQLGDRWANSWRLRGQPTGYCWGLRQYGLQPIGAIIRGVGILQSRITFAESIQPRAPWQIDQWLRQLQHDVQEMVECWYEYTANPNGLDVGDREGKAFPRNLDHACSDFGGCPYLSLCDTADPEPWLDDYRIEFWDPLAQKD
jgi:hypothetical protein